LRALRTRGVRALMVEGGARLTATLAQRVTRRPTRYLSVTPVLGAGALGAFAHVRPSTALKRHGCPYSNAGHSMTI